jgi:hypothetical protein
VTGLFAPGTSVFAWYAIGLLAALAGFFAITGRLSGPQHPAMVLGVRTEVPGDSHGGEQAPSPAAARPEAGPVS